MVEFRVLGPLEAAENGRPLRLGGTQQRALLALLLLHANELVPSDQLIDALWGEKAPATAATTVQVYISRLRKVIGRELLETRPPGYVLRVEPEQLDLSKFVRMVAAARETTDPAAAAPLLRDALALWRGPPLADLAYESFAQTEIARLAEQRLAALEERLQADLLLGRHAELVAELETLVEQHSDGWLHRQQRLQRLSAAAIPEREPQCEREHEPQQQREQQPIGVERIERRHVRERLQHERCLAGSVDRRVERRRNRRQRVSAAELALVFSAGVPTRRAWQIPADGAVQGSLRHDRFSLRGRRHVTVGAVPYVPGVPRGLAAIAMELNK